MATSAKATLSTNGDICGPITVSYKRTAVFSIEITGTITVTLKARYGTSSNFITRKKQDGTTDAAYTASDGGQIVAAPGEYELVASGVSGGSAICVLHCR